MKKSLAWIIFNVGVVTTVVVLLFLFLKSSENYPREMDDQETAQSVSEEKAQTSNMKDAGVAVELPVADAEEFSAQEPVAENPNPFLRVPFVLQAPFANWSDALFQDACEEAAILMAKGWLEGRMSYTKEQMEGEIRKIAELGGKMLGGFIDSSAGDTARMLKEYAGYDKVSVVEDVKADDIKNEIARGNLVIVPTDGRKLKNPFYTAPGPVTHMIVIVGYDSVKKEFVTNDSGTRMGEGYRYAEGVLLEAIRDYPTGNHYVNPIDEIDIEKTMIVVEGR